MEAQDLGERDERALRIGAEVGCVAEPTDGYAGVRRTRRIGQ